MSNVLAVAVWRAKAARQTPRTVNVIDLHEDKLKLANERIAELESLVARLKGQIGGLTTSLAKRHHLMPPRQEGFLKIEDVAEAVGCEFRIHILDMRSDRRTKDSVLARHVAMYLCRTLTNRSFPVVGKFFGNRDHTTVMHAYRSIAERRTQDSDLDAAIQRLERKLGSVCPPMESSAPAVPPAVGATIPGDA